MRIVLVVALVASVFAQQPDGQAFVGRWAADHDGLPVVRLDLRITAGTLGGSVQLADNGIPVPRPIRLTRLIPRF